MNDESPNVIEIDELRSQIDVLRGVVCALAGAAVVAMDVRHDRGELLQRIGGIARCFEAHAVGECPGDEEREIGMRTLLDFLADDVRLDDGQVRPKPVSVDFLGQQHAQLLQQVTGIVDRERQRDQMIKDLVASLQDALGPMRAEQP